MKNETVTTAVAAVTETSPTATAATTATTAKTAATTETGATATTQSNFSRKIGNTTFVVSVAFSDKASESIEDKILRLVASDTQQGVLSKCS